jgi:hypothetical protein
LLEFCKASGVRILNGRCYEDNNVGKYTCINTQGSSVINYVLCRIDLMQFISHFELSDQNVLSDHCYVHFNLKSCKIFENEDKTETDYSNIPYTYKWENSKRNCILVV